MSRAAPRPLLCIAAGLALAASAALPVTAESASPLAELFRAFFEDPFLGLLASVIVLPPYALGLLVATGLLGRSRVTELLAGHTLRFFLLELLLVGAGCAYYRGGIMDWALLGFATTVSVTMLGRDLRRSSEGPPTLTWLARHGGVAIAGTFVWFRLQIEADAAGAGIVVTAIAAATMAVAAARIRRSPESRTRR